MDNQKEYSRYMSNFRGIDATSEASNVSLNRFSFIQNMYKDYKSEQGVAIETFPGTRTLCKNLGGKIYGIHTYKVSSGKVHVIVHAGAKLYHFDSADRDKLNVSNTAPIIFSDITMNEAKSSSFVYNNRLYIIDGEHYIIVYQDYEIGLAAEYVDNDNAYKPTTFSNGEQYEQRNMLTNLFKEKTYVEQLDFNIIDVPTKPPVEDAYAIYYPSIGHSHKFLGSYGLGIDYCFAGSNGNDTDGEIYSGYNINSVREMTISAPSTAKKVVVDFGKFRIYWGECNADRWLVTKKDKNGNFVYVKTDIKPSYHKSEPETISVEDLAERKSDETVADSNGVYQFGFYQSISDDYLTESDASRRKLLTYVCMGDNVEEFEGTLCGCSNITTLLLSNRISHLAGDFFAGTNVDTIYLPYDLAKIDESGTGKKLFEDCGATTIYASGKKTSNNDISVYDELKNNRSKYGINDTVEIISYESKYMSGVPNNSSDIETDDANVKNRFYIKTPCKSIKSVHVNDGEIFELLEKPEIPKTETATLYAPVYKYLNGKWYIIAIDIYYEGYKLTYDGDENITGTEESKRIVNGDLVIEGEAHSSIFTITGEASNDSLTAHKNYEGNTMEAIKHCTVSCAFDDRIFFTGNPDLPNTVFYTQRDLTGHNNPTYVGVLNWFDDGMGNTPNVAMMSNASTLMVLKGNTMQDGSIYYHTGADGGNDLTPRIYPSVEGLAGLGCVGMAVNFRDDCVFMSNQGLEAIAKQTVNLERTIEHRSTNIDGLMLRSDLSLARAAEWEGYLCILIDGKMFLADSRQAFEGIGGAMEYEWYYVADVCGYDGDNLKYFLADYMPDFPNTWEPEGLSTSEDEDRSVNYKEVKSKYAVRYIVRDGKPLLVDSDGERENGTPDMACEICAVEDILFFGTEGGKLLCLNNDKRGTNENDPDKSRIPVEWYNNSGHAYISRAVLAMENAGVPHYTKTTVKRGTILRLKAFSQSAFNVYATTDRQATTLLTSQSNSVTTFDALNFENLGLLTADSGVLAIKEKTKKWVEKQYEFRNDKPNQPFGLYSITYRYTIAGDVKNK